MRLAPVTSGLAAHEQRFPVHLLATGLVFACKQMGEPRRDGALGPWLRYQKSPSRTGARPSHGWRNVVGGRRRPTPDKGLVGVWAHRKPCQLVWLKRSPLRNPRPRTGFTRNTMAPTGVPVAERPVAHNEFLRTIRVLDRERAATGWSSSSSVTCSAWPSTTTSNPPSMRSLRPVVSTHDAFSARFLAFRSSGPVVNQRASVCQTAISGGDVRPAVGANSG